MEEKTYSVWDVACDNAYRPKPSRKVILTLEEPMDCDHCPLHDLSSMKGDKLCLASGGRWIETQNNGIKPDWCPLKPMPQKRKTSVDTDLFEQGVDYGWNACLEEIEK